MLLVKSLTALWFLALTISASANDSILLTGSSTVAPLAAELGRIFEKENPKSRVDVQTGGSTKGIVDTRKGLNDIGMISRSLKGSEVDLRPFVLAKDGIAIIVHKENPVNEITKQQLLDIFTKSTSSWKRVTGVDLGNIVVVNKAAGRSTLEMFLKYLKLKESEVKADTIIGDNQQGIKAVSGSKLAIGYVSIGAALLEIELGAPIKVLKLDGVAPSIDNVKNGTYPIIRDLTLVTQMSLTKKQEKFLSFVRTKSASKVIESLSFVSIY